MTDIAIIVPCRLESSRFPRKLLHKVAGKEIALWVAERIQGETPEFPLYFAVDDDLLRRPLEARGFKVVKTSPSHASGTDRLAEANRQVGAKCVINVQADEPLVTGKQIRALAEMMRLVQDTSPTAGESEPDVGRVSCTRRSAMATLATPFRRAVDFQNPNQVKVVMSADGRALYFSRSPIPYPRDAAHVDDAYLASHPCFKHLGLYAYRADLLENFAKLPMGRYERAEKLEQLRVLENGFDIQVGITEEPSIGIDTAEDAERFAQWVARGSASASGRPTDE